MTDAYLDQVVHQLDQAQRDLRSAEDELARLRPLPAQLATARAELAALHEGEEPYGDERLVPTPGQWIWRWNRETPAERLSFAANRLDLLERVNRCTWGMHTARVAELHDLRQDWTAKVVELAEAKAERDRFAAGVPLICADDRHEAKVRGLEAQIAAVRTLAEGWEREHPRYGIGAQVLAALDGPADARPAIPLTAADQRQNTTTGYFDWIAPQRIRDEPRDRDAAALRDALNAFVNGPTRPTA